MSNVQIEWPGLVAMALLAFISIFGWWSLVIYIARYRKQLPARTVYWGVLCSVVCCMFVFVMVLWVFLAWLLGW